MFLDKQIIKHAFVCVVIPLFASIYQSWICEILIKTTDETFTVKWQRVIFQWKISSFLITTDTCSSLSDVWSFGVLMWEIYSRGKEPFSDISMSELPSKIKEGNEADWQLKE